MHPFLPFPSPLPALLSAPFRFFSPSKSALFCRAREGHNTEIGEGQFQDMGLSTKFGKDTFSPNSQEISGIMPGQSRDNPVKFEFMCSLLYCLAQQRHDVLEWAASSMGRFPRIGLSGPFCSGCKQRGVVKGVSVNANERKQTQTNARARKPRQTQISDSFKRDPKRRQTRRNVSKRSPTRTNAKSEN